MSPLEVRLMTEADVPRAAGVAAAAFDFDTSAPGVRRHWHMRMRHPLLTDPGGAFVAERDGQLIGVAQALIRDRVWVLSTLTVDPAVHSDGAGRALMDAALSYGRRLPDGLIVASNDTRALRLYGSSGFRLEPTFEATGRVDPALIPELHPEIVLVPPDQVQTLAPISRAVRGAEHTPDFAVVFDRGGSVFGLDDRGFAIVLPGRGVWGPIARDTQAAAALLWHALAQLTGEHEVAVRFVTGRQQWAVEVLLAARLSIRSAGALGVRGNPGPLHPYIPTTPFA